MKTEDLIAQLAADPAPAPASTLERRVMVGLAGGLLVTAAAFFWVLGPRPDLVQYLAQPVILAKTVLPLVLGLLALVLALRAARPAVAPGWAGRAIWAVPIAAAALWLWAFAVTPPEARMAGFLGHSIRVCLPAVVLLSLPISAGLITALSKGAPTRPRLGGALAGLAAGGIACAIYSTFCVEDTPMFYAAWYSLGICLAAGTGALAGPRFLRW
ncbi:NrsF family protein [Pseudooceanicola sp. LIPI14-2-Ac024]|uniref:NrsF family protein n=1 Tax=Pseudooceanicola sp. LIPI14-2-Ac024 TaxID=3344875 RepID=UPI0035CFFB27